MRVSFTGTRKGMTPEQKNRFFIELISHDAEILIHGDCLGADSDAHDIAQELGVSMQIRPCDLDAQRAWRSGEDVHEPKAPLERNRDIVDAGDMLIATPDGMKEQMRSGTWATIRYGRKSGKSVLIIYPDGSVGS